MNKNHYYKKGKRAGYRRGFVDGMLWMMMGSLALVLASRFCG